MVNTRAKIQKIQNTKKLCFSETAIDDSTQMTTLSGILISSNDDLLIEILLRLPVTSVLRFKSVSKHWQSLLSHRRFTLRYKNASTSPGLFVRNFYIPFDIENRNTPPFRNLDFYPDIFGIKIVQSCNGLLLCCSDRAQERARKYYVFNPTTKQFALIPSVPGGNNVRKTIHLMGLAFHPTDFVHYKVVCIRSLNPNEGQFQIQIYSSVTGKWKITHQSFSASHYEFYGPLVYWNQAVYSNPFSHTPSYFRLDTEELQLLPLPVGVASLAGLPHGVVPLYFGESLGHLHLVVKADSNESYLHMNVYEMLNDHSGWFLKYRVELDELPDAYPEMIHKYQEPSTPPYYDFQLLDVVRGGEGDETFMVIEIPGKIIRYNIVDKSFKEIFDASNIFYGRIWCSEVHRYIETLVSF